jgi:biotin carboxyl carrier protein
MEQHNQSNKENLVDLIVDDMSYKTRLNEMYKRRKPYQPIIPSHLKSFMPGNIPDVFVKEGDQVKEGETLLILEAMKMKNLIKAPFDGIIKKIHVKAGDIVPKNFVLIEMSEQVILPND